MVGSPCGFACDAVGLSDGELAEVLTVIGFIYLPKCAIAILPCQRASSRLEARTTNTAHCKADLNLVFA